MFRIMHIEKEDKMKRLLSFILVFAMVIAILPTVSVLPTASAEEPATATLTFDFTSTGRSDVSDKWLEKIVCDKSGNLGTADALYTRKINPKYAVFPVATASAEEQWAYLGTGQQTGLRALAKGSDDNASIEANFIENGTYISTNADGKNTWIAFKIRVPETSTYTITGGTASKYNYAATQAYVYMIPLDSADGAVFMNESTYGSLDVNSSNIGVRTGMLDVTTAGNIYPDGEKKLESYYAGRILTLRTAEEFSIDGAKSFELEKNKDYVLFIRGRTAGPIRLKTLSFSYELPEPPALESISASFDTVSVANGDVKVGTPTVKWFSEGKEIEADGGEISVEIESDPDGILRTEQDGSITAVAQGKANLKVTGTLRGVSQSCIVTLTVNGKMIKAYTTFNFTNTGRSDVPDSWLERIVCDKSGNLGTSAANYSFEKNPKYTAFPASLDDPDEQWAYLGTSFSMGTRAFAQGTDPEKKITANYIENNGCLSSANNNTKGWYAFKIRVPETAEYTFTNGTANSYAYASTMVWLYVIPMDGAGAVFSEESIYGTAGINASNYGIRTGAKDITDAEFADYRVGTLPTSILRAANEFDIENRKTVTLEKGKEYVLLIRGRNASTIPIKTLSMSYEVPAPPDLEKIEANFGNTFVGNKIPKPEVSWFAKNDEPLDGTEGSVAVEIADDQNGVLKVGTDGNIYAIAEGTATLKVTGKLYDVEKSVEVPVTVTVDNTWSGASAEYLFYNNAYGEKDANGNDGYAITVPGAVSGDYLSENDFYRSNCLDYGSVPTIDGKIRNWAMVSAHVSRPSNGEYFKGANWRLDLSGNRNDWVAFKIKIPAPGKYRLDSKAYAYYNGGLAKFWMLPYDESMNFASVTQNIEKIMSEDNFVGEMELNQEVMEGQKLISSIGCITVPESAEFEEKGYTEYLMVIQGRKSNLANPSVVMLYSIHLEGEPALKSIATTLASNEIGTGEVISIEKTVGYVGAGIEVGLSSAYVEYRVAEGSENIIEMMPDGKSFRALSEGKGKVVTEVMLDGITCTYENTVTVDNNFTVSKAYLYPETSYETKANIVPAIRLELNNRKIVSEGEISEFELVDNSEGAVTLSADKKTLTAKTPGKAMVKATVSARGKTFESDTVEIVVVEAVATGTNVKKAALDPGEKNIDIYESFIPGIRLFDDKDEEIVYKPEDIKKVVWTSSDISVAEVSEDGSVYGVGEGECEINAAITYIDTVVSAKTVVTVSDNSGISSDVVTVFAPSSIYVYGGGEVSLSVDMESGNKVKIPAEHIIWKYADDAMAEVLEISPDGSVYGLTVGSATLCPEIDPTWKNIGNVTVSPITIDVVWDSTIDPQLYTIQDRANALENVKKYDWAKALRDTAVSKAERYLNNIDKIYNSAAPEGIPRAYYNGQRFDPNNVMCRYCEKDLTLEYGKYGFSSNFFSTEWKVQCPYCKRLFPSNDFASFYKLGLSESGKFWNYDDALQKHHEMFVCEHVAEGEICTHERPIDSAPKPGTVEWYENDPRDEEWKKFYGYDVKGGYLTNDLYTEMETKYDIVGWGVDDGFGYRQPYITKEQSETGTPGYDARYFNKDGYAWYNDGTNTGPVIFNWIAYAGHDGIWKNANRDSSAYYYYGVMYLRDAFLYTGEAKYARAGAIMLDKIADLWPYFDWHLWAGVRTDDYKGKVEDSGSSTYYAQEIVDAYDAFLPIYNDPYVINYLSKNGAQYEIDERGNYIRDNDGNLIPVNMKETPGAIRKNFEENFLIQTYIDAQHGRIKYNNGITENCVAAVAIALNKEPYTSEIFDWIMRYDNVANSNIDTGSVMETLKGSAMENIFVQGIDRDGIGHENSAQYNYFWIQYYNKYAEKVAKFTQDPDNSMYEKYDLFNNPKFRKMYMGHIRLTLGGYYTAQIGDTYETAGTTLVSTVADLKVGYKYTKDPIIAQAMYMLNGNTAEGLYYGIFDKDPEGLTDEVQAVIDEFGTITYESDMLAGFGFAVLRAGGDYKSVSASTRKNNMRDMGIYFGANSGHGHIGGLGLYMDVFGLNIAPDLGYPEQTGSDPNRMQWVRSTISHNTVVVDESDQTRRPVTYMTNYVGTPYHFDDAGRVKVMDIAQGDYEQCDEYRRSVIMVEVNDDISYGVDFFHVKGGDDHLYSFHSQSDELFAIDGLNDLYTQPTYVDEAGNEVGTYAGPDVIYGPDMGGVGSEIHPMGYTWLKNIRTYNSIANNFSVEYKVKDWNKVLDTKRDIRLRLTMVNDDPMEEVTFATGKAPATKGNKNIGNLEYLIVRNKGKNLDTTFTTVFEPYDVTDKYIDSIEKVSMVRKEGQKPGINDAYSAVRVTLKNGRVDYVIYSNNNLIDYIVDGRFEFRGFAGVVTLNVTENSDKIVYIYLNDGDVLKEKNADQKVLPAVAHTGTVTSFTDQMSLENSIIYKPALTIENPAELIGKYVYIDNTGLQNGAYKIEGAKITSDGDIELDIGDVTLIRKYIDPYDVSLGYEYNIKEGQNLRVPISKVYDESPHFKQPSDYTTSVGSSVTIPLNAYSDNGKEISLIGTSMPRGMIIDEQAQTVTWKPTSSQVGENHVAITATDGTLETTVHFTVTVYGSTTGTLGTGNSAVGNSGNSGSGSGATTPVIPETPSTDEKEGKDEAHFTDLGAHAWAADAINALADGGIIKGTSETTFSPANNITRADFAILLVRAFKLTSDNTENFVDVSTMDYFAKELAVARNTGLVNGIGDNKYAPRNTITRQDMMTIVYRAMQKLGVELEVKDVEYADFTDVADYAKEAVSVLVDAGLVNGKSGKIAPTDYTTRAEVAVLLKRILDYTQK